MTHHENASAGDNLSNAFLDPGRQQWVAVGIALLVLVLGLNTYLLIAGTPVSFDGAMNLQVAAALADGQGYGRFYDEWRLFPREIQTNAPYVFPAALIFVVFGVSLATAQWVSLAYLAGLVIVVFMLGRRIAGTIPGLVACVLILLVPKLERFGANGYGEVPALVWLLAGLLFIHIAIDSGRERTYFVAGLCLGLAVLTKTVMLMPVGVVLGVFGLAFLVSDRAWKQPIALAGGGLVPIVLWEAWKLWSFANLGSWIGWWQTQLDGILAQAGVSDGFRDSPGVFEKLTAHAEVLAGSLGLPIWSLPILALVPLALVAVAILRVRERGVWRASVLVPLMIAACIAAYFVWWLFVTPTQKAWYRRIFIGVLLLTFSAPLLPALAARLRGRAALVVAGTLSSVLLLVGSLVRFEWADFEPDVREHSTREVVAFMQAAPESARFYGYRWYSQPVFGLYSGRRILNIDKRKYWIDQSAGPHLFLADGYTSSAGMVGAAVGHIPHHTVVDYSDWGRIFRLDGEYILPQPSPSKGIRLMSAVRFLEQEYEAVSGLVGAHSEGWRWAEPEASAVLLSNDAKSLAVEGYLPVHAKYRYSGKGVDFGMQARVADCNLRWQYLGDAGRFRAEWSLSECSLPPAGDTVTVTLRTNAILVNPERPLSWIVHQIALNR